MQYGLFDSTQREAFMLLLLKGEGMDCPCCRRHAQIYTRILHYTTAAQLIRLYRLNGYGEYVNASELLLKGQHGTGDFQKAKYWNLIERRPNGVCDEASGKKTSGWWRLTDDGASFVLGKKSIRRVARVFDDKVIEFCGPMVDIKEALGTRFSYEKLMDS